MNKVTAEEKKEKMYSAVSSLAQYEIISKAAKLRDWSISRYVSNAAYRLAQEDLKFSE